MDSNFASIGAVFELFLKFYIKFDKLIPSLKLFIAEIEDMISLFNFITQFL